MIDHVSIAVRDLKTAAAFYEAALAPLGMKRLREWPESVGFGKAYPEFWLNQRAAMTKIGDDNGAHVCLRAIEQVAVDAFHAAAMRAGGLSDGAPGLRPEYTQTYYAAFIRDLDGNRIEVVTFLK